MIMQTARRQKEQPSVYQMKHRAARLGYTLIEAYGPAPDFAATYTINRGWPNGTETVKTFKTRIQVYTWLSKQC